MFLLDVNVVVAAHRDDHPQHEVVRPWFDDLVAGDEPFTVPNVVWGSFLRLVTHRKIFACPTTLDEAFAFIDAVEAQPHHLSTGPGPRHLTLLRSACTEGGATANLVPDAVLVAVAAERSCTIATMDRDFARFPRVPHVLITAGEPGDSA